MKAMKSQALAFLLGFAVTSCILFFIPGVSKRTSQANTKVQKLAGAGQNPERNDSSSISNGHLNTNAVVVTP